jgi:hypothetical protein
MPGKAEEARKNLGPLLSEVMQSESRLKRYTNPTDQLKAVVAGAIQRPLTRDAGEIAPDGGRAGTHSDTIFIALGAEEIGRWIDAGLFQFDIQVDYFAMF